MEGKEIDRSSDQEIVEKVMQGDRQSYALLVRKYQKALLRMSYRMVKDLDVAEDVVQEALIKAYQKLNSFEGRASFKSWLFQITVNTAKNKLRERRDGVVDISQVNLAEGPKAENQLLQNAVSGIIQKAVESLPERQRMAMILRIYDDLSFQEIAEVMDCPYDTAKANYRHALIKIKQQLQDQHDLREWQEDFGSWMTELSRKVVEAEL